MQRAVAGSLDQCADYGIGREFAGFDRMLDLGVILIHDAAGAIQFFELKTPLNVLIAQPTSAALFGNLAQANHFASHATLGLLSLAYLSGRSARAALAAGLCALPLLFVLGVSGSRSVWLYLLAAFVLAAWLRRIADDRASKRIFMVVGGFVASYFLMQLVVQAGWIRPPQREAVTALERLFTSPGSVADRFSLWGAFAAAYFDHVTAIDADNLFRLYQNSHNIVLQLLAETGLVGGALLVVPMLAWAGHALRAPRNTQLWWLLALIGVIAIHSLLEYPLWYAYFLGIAALLLGAADPPAFGLRKVRLLVFTVLLAGAFNLAVQWTDYRTFERIFHPRAQELPPANLVGLMTDLHRNPLLMPYVELSTALALGLDETGHQQQLFLNTRALRFSPPPRQVLLLALAGRPLEAQEQLQRARRAYREPAEFTADLERLARSHPALMRPLLESAPRSAQTHP